MNPRMPTTSLSASNVELVRLGEAEGRVAAGGGAAVSAGRAVRGARRGLGRRRAALFPRAGGGGQYAAGLFAGAAGVYSETDPDGGITSGCMATC